MPAPSPTTDKIQLLRHALVAIVSSSAGVQAIAGRTTGLIIPWRDAGLPRTLPIIAYLIITAPETGGAGDNREVAVKLTSIADGDDADRVANGLASVLETALTPAAFAVQNLDAVVLRQTRTEIPISDEASRSLYRADLDLTIWATW